MSLLQKTVKASETLTYIQHYSIFYATVILHYNKLPKWKKNPAPQLIMTAFSICLRNISNMALLSSLSLINAIKSTLNLNHLSENPADG